LQDFVTKSPVKFDAFNLSDIFEYLSIESYERLLRLLIRSANPNARLAYWNLLVPRSRPESLVALLQPLKELSEALSRRDKAFIYKTIVVEEVLGTFSRALEVNQREVGTFPSLQALASGR
jgi:S-adenosylmethionine-diacylglycerol 3-amino-3-carboxypropyl transferase